MKYLNNGVSSQTISIIPRKYSTNLTVYLRDNSTNEEVSYNITGVVDNNYLDISSVFSLVDGRFYDLRVEDSYEVIYKDKVFCTNQVVSQISYSERVFNDGGTLERSSCLQTFIDNNGYYSINQDEYTQHASNNNYIIL